ncbi:MAG: hypothetical protein HXY35_10085 [Chloroflexi bacterium]|nr:hypothetical protein [Chloroflexota bacterium]
MSKTKVLASILIIAAMLFAQVGLAAAAPAEQETTSITGTIQSITTETDANGTTTVLVTLVDTQGTTQTVRLSVETAVTLGLVTLDPTTGAPAVDQTKVGQSVEIDPTTVIPDEPVEEEPLHPIAALLGSFFGVDGSIIDEYHQDGFGFGVIAQALWMSKNLNGDATLAGLILEAKKTGDYSAFILPDGTVPTNWGQFKKAISDKKNNLGVIVSGKAENDNTPPAGDQQENGKGKDKDKGNGNGNGNGKNKP